MTSHLTPQTINHARKPAQGRASESSASLGALVERLRALDAAPSLAELKGWLQEVEVEEGELSPFVGFKSGTYARHRVF
ncbi:MAG TPA: hypothetical protein VF754_06565, partial [Pyrinomonadaceae bacterium]